MADSFISIPNPTGSPDPYKVDSRTVNTDEHRQVVVIGDPATNANVAAVNASGEIAVAAHAVTNAGTFAVQVSSLPALVAGTANIGDVDVLTVPADPFGANADAGSTTGSISAKLKFIAATGIPVTALPALAAGTNAIGKLAANSGVDIGDVDVASVVPGTGATSLGKAVDDVAGATDSGVVALAMRKTTLATITPADGDYTTLRTSQRGALWVVLDSTLLTATIEGSLAHDAPATDQQPVLTGAYAKAAAPTDVSADGDLANLWALRNGSLVVNIASGGALVGGDAPNGLDVDVTRLPALVAGTANIGDVDVLTLPALPTGANVIGAVTQSGTWNVGTVTAVTAISNALPAGTNAIGKLAANSGVDIGDVDVPMQLAGTATLSNVADSASSISLLSSNAARKGATFFNDSDQDLYLKYGTTASLTSFTVKIPALGFWEMPYPITTVAIDGIWAANSTGSARITELT